MLGGVAAGRAGRSAAAGTLALAAIAGCRSTAARIDTLEKLHADDGSHVNKIQIPDGWMDRSIDSVLGAVHLAPKRAPIYETVENPSLRCAEEIQEIGRQRFDSLEQLGSAVAILSRIALTDRSHVNRSYALFGLRQIAVDWLPRSARANAWEIADASAGRAAFDTIRAIHGDDGRHKAGVADADAKCLAAMQTAGRTRWEKAGDARAMLKLFVTFRRLETSGRIRATITAGLPRLAVQTAMLTHVEALSDDRDWVRRDAADGLGVIAAKGSAVPLCTALAAEKDVEVRWALLRALGRLGDPSTASEILAAASRPDTDPTTRSCAVQALRAVTHRSLGDDLEAWRAAVSPPAPGDAAEEKGASK
jgi:HEAT repeat protein